MSLRFIHSLVFKRFFRLFSLTFLLPSLVLGIVAYLSLFAELRRQVLYNTGEVFVQIASQLETNIRRVQLVSDQVQSTPLFQRAYSFDSFDEFSTARDVLLQLRAYTQVDSFFSDLFFYQRRSGHLITSATSVDLGYAEILLQMPAEWRKEFVDTLAFEEEDTLIGPVTSELRESNGSASWTGLYYLRPIRQGTRSVASIVFRITEQALDEVLSPPETLESADLVLMLDGATVYPFDSVPEGFVGGATVHEQAHQLRDPRFTLTARGNSYWFRRPLSFLNLQLIMRIDDGLIRTRMSTVRILLLSTFGMVLVIGIAVSYVFARRLYRPIWTVYELATQANPDEMPPEEFSAIAESLRQLAIEKRELTSRISKSRRASRQYLFARLLRGSVNQRDEIRELAHGQRLMKGDAKYLAAILLARTDGAQTRDPDTLAQEISAGSPVHVRETVNPRRYELIIELPECEEYEPYIGSIHERLQQLIQVQSLAVGAPVDHYLDLQRSYLQAEAALEYRFVHDHGCLLFFDAINDRRAHERPPAADVRNLRKHVLSLNAAGVSQLLKETRMTIMKSSASVTQSRSIVFDVKYAYYNSLADLRKEHVFPLNELWEEQQLESAETLNDVFDAMRVNFESVIQFIRSTDSNPFHGNRVDPQIQFLKRNFKDPELSLHSMADRFQLSPAHLSRSFKQRTGVGINDYLTYLRIKEAKTLLSDTDEPIETISHKVGYHNTTSFIRRFKQKEGITPGQFRKMEQ